MSELLQPNSLAQVARFHRTFGHPILVYPTIPSLERANLRIELLQEELNELKQAIEDNSVVDVADALCDLQYVLSGAVLEFGMGSRFNALFNEVQRSNMSKACNNLQQAEETVAHYNELGTETYYQEMNGKYIIYRKSDNKIMKAKNYSPAELKTHLI
jgi:predicted HAD superfamily Cof-like phosphohydrolase